MTARVRELRDSACILGVPVLIDTLISAVRNDERDRCRELVKDSNCEAMFLRGCPLFSSAPLTVMDAKTGKITGNSIISAAKAEERERILSGNMTHEECERQYRALFLKLFPQKLDPKEVVS